ncbi:hypothetical protein PGB28_16275 [Primorskyibacter aestuariivivens]|uniref:hypothetical protein n=1 Tax=Primorskyibacter aestuariivivens TaxID=1888912 RepID=UPI002301255F|nr:hypothetical protein [Primorskyibacter aestuariivivens]MDA7430023.1 hypothetical protein [Primorskyibacter aestuariivivens]
MIPPWVIALLALGTAALFAAMGAISWVHLMPDGALILDARWTGYTASDVATYFMALGPLGISKYAGPLHVLDTVFPAMLAITLAACVLRASRPWRQWTRLLLLVAPAGYAVIDYGENALVAELLRNWQGPLDPATVMLASRFTVTKYVLLGATVAIWLGLMLGRRKG